MLRWGREAGPPPGGGSFEPSCRTGVFFPLRLFLLWDNVWARRSPRIVLVLAESDP